jgi:hypothetical protein
MRRTSGSSSSNPVAAASSLTRKSSFLAISLTIKDSAPMQTVDFFIACESRPAYRKDIYFFRVLEGRSEQFAVAKKRSETQYELVLYNAPPQPTQHSLGIFTIDNHLRVRSDLNFLTTEYVRTGPTSDQWLHRGGANADAERPCGLDYARQGGGHAMGWWSAMNGPSMPTTGTIYVFRARGVTDINQATTMTVSTVCSSFSMAVYSFS